MTTQNTNSILQKNKLKKYILLISFFIFFVSGIHLGYQYLYHDAKTYPIEGGSISEGLIGDFPSLNPLKPYEANNGYFMDLLYRSMLSYDNSSQKIISDIASCDISNLAKIECYMQESAKWSNGESITIDDVLATYDLLKTSEINPVMNSLLTEAKFTKNGDTLIITNSTRDVNFLNIFFQPILSAGTIESIGKENLSGSFSTIGQIYSGKFKISNVQQDSSIGVTKFILEKNEFYQDNPVLIDQLIIKLFPNTATFNKNKETINVFQDDNKLIGTSLPRFEVNEYLLPQYVSLFLNKETISDVNLRNFILNKISRENLVKLLGENEVIEVKNPYIGETELAKEENNKNYESLIAKTGYKKKSQLIQGIIPEKKSESYYSQEITAQDVPEDKSFDEFQKDSDTIIQPTYVEKYNFITKDNIRLEGKAGKEIEAVYINDYKLQGYKSGDSIFYYRLSEAFNSLKPGVNEYKIYFEKSGKKELIEEIIFLYNSDASKLKRLKDEYLDSLYIEKIKKQRAEEKVQQDSQPEVDQARLKELADLDEKYYYNDKYERFTLDLYYVATDKNIDKSAQFIKNSLMEMGIHVELHPVSISGLVQILAQKDAYDMILTGINLGYFEQNIFPYFHSSQVKNGFNFSNLKKGVLDLYLEELKRNIGNTDSIEKNQEKVLEILKEEQVVKTLYSPKYNLIVDKNIKNLNFPEKIQQKQLRSLLYDRLYTNDKKVVNFEEKTTLGFFVYLIEKIYE